jgi:hypothetical protein
MPKGLVGLPEQLLAIRRRAFPKLAPAPLSGARSNQHLVKSK